MDYIKKTFVMDGVIFFWMFRILFQNYNDKKKPENNNNEIQLVSKITLFIGYENFRIMKSVTTIAVVS